MWQSQIGNQAGLLQSPLSRDMGGFTILSKSYGYMWNVVLPGTAFSKILFDGKGGFYHTGIGIHALSVLPEHKMVYIYRYDTDGEYQDPGDATIQLVSMIMNARLSK